MAGEKQYGYLTTTRNQSTAQVGDTLTFTVKVTNTSANARTYAVRFADCVGMTTPSDFTVRVLKNSSSWPETITTTATASGRCWLMVYLYPTTTSTTYDDIAAEYVDVSDVIRVEKPTLVYNVKEYSDSGREIDKADFSTFDSTAYYLTNNTGTNPGAYTCKLVCNDGYGFTDDTREAEYDWEIHKTNITKPTQIKASTDYTGGYQSPDSSWFSNWSSWCTLNVEQKINHSDTAYDGTITLYNEYCFWSDNTQTPITFFWVINKIYQTLSFYPSSATIIIGNSTTATMQGNPIGSYGQPTGQSHTTATYNLGVISVTGVSVGTDTLKVTYSGDQNHYQGYAEFEVTVTNPAPPTINGVRIYANGAWHTAVPYIYNNGWHRAQTYIYNNGWHKIND